MRPGLGQNEVLHTVLRDCVNVAVPGVHTYDVDGGGKTVHGRFSDQILNLNVGGDGEVPSV